MCNLTKIVITWGYFWDKKHKNWRFLKEHLEVLKGGRKMFYKKGSSLIFRGELIELSDALMKEVYST